MRYAAAYLLAILGGHSSPDVDAIEKIFASVGIECDRERAQMIVDACQGRDVNEIISEGMKKLDEISLGSGPAVVDTAAVNQINASVTPAEDPADQTAGNDDTPPGSPDGDFLGLFD